MSRLSEFMARGAPPEGERARSPVRSISRGPAVVLKGWNKGMDKAAVTLLLRKSGVPLARAHDATNSILRNEPVSVRFPGGADVTAIRRSLEQLGVVL